MFWKFAATLAVLMLAWFVLFRATPRRRDGANRRKRTVQSQDLTKCPGCGIYLPPDRSCGCRESA